MEVDYLTSIFYYFCNKKLKTNMKKTTITLLLIAFSLLFGNEIQAQLKFKNFACPNFINCLAEEGNFLWVGTSNGLYKRNKINGQVVSYYSIDDGLANNVVRSIAIDGQGNKWIGTWHGFSKFNELTNTWTSFPILESAIINSVVVDLSGNVWVGVFGNLLRYDQSTWSVYSNLNSPLAINVSVTSLAVDNLNNIWIGTNTNGFYEFKNDTLTWNHYTTTDGLANNGVLSILADLTGRIWIGTDMGLSSFSNSTFTNYTISNSNLIGNNIYSLAIGGNNNLWIGTNLGISSLSLGVFTTYHANISNPSNDIITAIVPDQQGNVWFGTVDGLAKYSGTLPMPLIRINNAIIDSYVNSAIKDNSGNMWFATRGGISKYYEPTNTWTNYTSTNGLPNDYSYDILFDQSGFMWVSTVSGVTKYNGTTFLAPTLFSGLTSMHLANNNHIWGVTTSNGVYEWNGSSWINYNTGNSGLPNNYVKKVEIDNANNKWFVLNTGGITKFNGSTWTTYTTSNGLLSNNIGGLVVDSTGNIWAASDAGLNRFNGSTWQSYPHVFYGSNSLSLDSLGNLWVGSFYDGYAKITTAGKVANYRTTEGLVSNNTFSSYIDESNNKWFATANGVSKASCYNLVPTFTTDTVCYPPLTATHFVNTTLHSDSTTSFQWDINTDNVYEYTSWNLTHLFPSFGIHPVKMRALNDNCISTAVEDAVVGSMPNVNIMPSGTINLCQGSTMTLFGDLQNPFPTFNYSYLWNHDNITSPFFFADTTGDYFVTVKNNTCTANSDTVHVNQIVPFSNQEICMVTVDTITGKNMILWAKTPNQGIEFYNIYKETAANVYQPIGNVHKSQPGKFIDVNSDASIKSDRYKIAVGDTCGNQSELSPEHKTLHLTVSLGNNNQHNLIWENYEGFTFGKYFIYRTNQFGILEVIDSIQSNITTYTDITNIPGSVSYLIVIQKGDSCFIGDAKTQTQTYTNSVSNMEEYKLIGVDEISNPYFELNAFPNPFTNNTNISYTLSAKAYVKLEVYNVLGEKVKTLVNESQNAGTYNFNFSTENIRISAGVYYLKIEVNGFVKTKKIVEINPN